MDVHILPLKQAFSFDNSTKGIKKFIDVLKLYEVSQIVCEASGGYETDMINKFKEQGYKTWQVEPKRIKAFIILKGNGLKLMQ